MPRLFALPLLAIMLFDATAQAHEFSADGVRIAHPFATPTPPGAPNGAAYLDIITGQEDISLNGVSSPVSTLVEIHAMTMESDIMRMRRLEVLDIPAGETLKMRPGGGVHLMLIGLEDALEEGDTFPLMLEFAGRDSIEVEVRVQASGAGSEAADRHHQ